MERTNKTKYLLLIMSMLLISIGSILTGCFEIGGWRPDSPNVSINAESYCLIWNEVDDAWQYKVYCNNKVVSTFVPSQAMDGKFMFIFEDLLTETGDYNFYVLSHHQNGRESEKSNVVSYSCAAPYSVTSQILGSFDALNASEFSITAHTYGTNLYINPGETTADSYELYLYSESTGLNIFPINGEPTSQGTYVINLNNYMNVNYGDIYAMRIGTVVGDTKEIASKIYYYNRYSFAPYTSPENIYIFDGHINDAYINSIQELRNLVYYNFIYRIPNQQIRISTSFESLLNAVYSEGKTLSITDALAYAVTDCFNYFYETRDAYSISVKYIADMQFNININYDQGNFQNNDAKSEPATSLYPSNYKYKEIDWDTFYETCGYNMRCDDPKYNLQEYVFDSDKQFLYVEVESSEELYWAIENHYTPICKPGSTASWLYQDIKDILNSIISDSMTDYEKTLSIFDWICATTSYDYYSISPNGYLGVAANLVPAYYLEGVFVTKYAVCDGFSKAFSVMCNMEGIECMRVAGEVLMSYNEKTDESVYGGHAWNKVKIDISETDNIGAQYYMVDITWTEMVGSNLYAQRASTGKEVSTHEYFLVDDNYVDTHYEFDKREKYQNLKTGTRYNYYDDTTFLFDAYSYGLLNSSIDDVEHNLVIENRQELQAMFYYMLVNGRESIEIIIDYNYMLNIHRASGGTINDKYDLIVNSLIAELKANKFAEQYITVNSSQYELITYNSYGFKGVLLVMEQHLLIDDIKEPGHMVHYFDHYGIYQQFELYIEHDILSNYSGKTLEDRVRNMFAVPLSNSGLGIEVEYVDCETKLNGIQYIYNITFYSTK